MNFIKWSWNAWKSETFQEKKYLDIKLRSPVIYGEVYYIIIFITK